MATAMKTNNRWDIRLWEKAWFVAFFVMCACVVAVFAFGPSADLTDHGIHPSLVLILFLWGAHNLVIGLPWRVVVASPQVWLSSRKSWLIRTVWLLVALGLIWWGRPYVLQWLPGDPPTRWVWVFMIACTALWGVFNLFSQLPRFLLVGGPNTGKTQMLHSIAKQSSCSKIRGWELLAGGQSAGVEWLYTEDKVLICVPSDTVRSNHDWPKSVRARIGHCPFYRLDGLLFAISVEELVKTSVAIQKEQIDVLIETFGSLPVYVLITKVDRMVGFRELFEGQGRDPTAFGVSVFSTKHEPYDSVRLALDEKLRRLAVQLEGYCIKRLEDIGKRQERFHALGFCAEFAALRERLLAWVDSATAPELSPLRLWGVYFFSTIQTIEEPLVSHLNTLGAAGLAGGKGSGIPLVRVPVTRAEGQMIYFVRGFLDVLGSHLAQYPSLRSIRRYGGLASAAIFLAAALIYLLLRPVTCDDHSATGQPTIRGKPKVGQQLTVITKEIADANGLSDVAYTYKWFICLVPHCDPLVHRSDIESAKYTLTKTDVRFFFKVTVGFKDDAGCSETLTSAATKVIDPPVWR